MHNTAFTISLTHNFVDATNLGDSLRDVVSTFEEDRPMLQAMRRAERLEFWSDTLQVEESAVCGALLQVAELVSSTAVEEAVAEAARGDEACAALLHAALAPAVREVKPRLEALVEEFLGMLM